MVASEQVVKQFKVISTLIGGGYNVGNSILSLCAHFSFQQLPIQIISEDENVDNVGLKAPSFHSEHVYTIVLSIYSQL
ncbi:hypothetical protein Trydic_g16356 [Trypoxylus dichotomus]